MTTLASIGVAFDLDGTLYLGDEQIPGADRVVALLRSWGASICFVTNNPRKSREQYAEKLRRLGIPASPGEILTSANLMVAYLSQYAEDHWAPYLVLGEQQLVSELSRAGYAVTDSAHAPSVIVSFDTAVTYERILKAFRAISRGARFMATNPDTYCPSPDGGLPDAGFLIAGLEAATGRPCQVVVGKPSQFLGAELLRQLGLPKDRVVMVGDRPETDIVLGNRMGMRTALVRTGAAKPAVLAPDEKPTWDLASIADLPDVLRPLVGSAPSA